MTDLLEEQKNWEYQKMFQLTEELFNKMKYDLEVLISFCSDSNRNFVPTSELLDLVLDVYANLLKVKNEC